MDAESRDLGIDFGLRNCGVHSDPLVTVGKTDNGNTGVLHSLAQSQIARNTLQLLHALASARDCRSFNDSHCRDGRAVDQTEAAHLARREMSSVETGASLRRQVTDIIHIIY